MTRNISFQEFASQLREFIERFKEISFPVSENSASEFNHLALTLFTLQFENVPTYRALCALRKKFPETIRHSSEIPAMPTSAFKELDLSSIAPDERTKVFHSSGTTAQVPSRHFHNTESLTIYEASLLPWFKKNFLGDWEEISEEQNFSADKPGLIFLTPSPALAPHSSLVHMFETVRCELGSRDSFFGGVIGAENSWQLDIDKILFGVRKSMCANRPIGILGTAFSFVHLLDYFEEKNIRYRLAAGSRVIETGGYKGRSREMPKAELHRRITKYFGIRESHIVCEYGMSELSSQAYDNSVAAVCDRRNLSDAHRAPLQRIFHFPPWARAQIISPDTGIEVSDGETGLIRVFDLANIRSVLAIQTEDLAIRRGDGFALIGRAANTEPRGCSLLPESNRAANK